MEPSGGVCNNVNVVEPEDIVSADCAGKASVDGEEGMCSVE